MTVFPVKFTANRSVVDSNAVRDRAVNMRLCYALVEILSAQMVGSRKATIPESQAFRTRHEVPRLKKETRDETYHHVIR